jgi:hypothetical protein
MLFYRVEKDNHGPYRTIEYSLMDFLERNKRIDYSNCSFDDFLRVCPSPASGGDTALSNYLLEKYPDDSNAICHYVFGFDTIEKLIAWFSQYNQFDFLIEEDYTIKVYETEDYCTSEYQTIARNLTFVKELSLDEVI